MNAKTIKTVFIAVALGFAIGSFIATDCLSEDSVKPRLYQQELLTQWPRAILENLVWDDDGENLYISNLGAGTIDRYSVKTKSVTTFATLNWPASPDGRAHPFGIAVDVDGMIYGGAVKSPLTSDRKGLKNAVFKVDKQGNVTWVREEVPGTVWNGWTRLAPGVFLICDGYGGMIWKLDIKKQTLDKWVESPLLEPIKGERVPGANGIKIYKNVAYVTSSALSLIVQVPIDEHGNAGKVEVYKSDIKPDDFCISNNGNLYVTTHPQNVIYVIKNRGRPEIIADANGTGVNDWWTKGNTAAVFGKGGDKAQWIYVISDGGVWSCGGNESCLKPASLTRIYVGEEGYQGEN